jgi:hypothetical protein
LALAVGAASGVEGLALLGHIIACRGFSPREGASGGVILALESFRAVLPPVEFVAGVAGAGRGVVGLPPLPRVLRDVDILVVARGGLSGGKEGIVDLSPNGVELRG